MVTCNTAVRSWSLDYIVQTFKTSRIFEALGSRSIIYRITANIQTLTDHELEHINLNLDPETTLC